MAWKLLIGLFSLNFFLEKYYFYLLHHLLASGDPDGRNDCHGHQPGQARTNEVEHLKQCSEDSDKEHDHVENAEGDEASG